ncbi:hypothetical protein WJX77_003055 [Trebouxia sp. C0004]
MPVHFDGPEQDDEQVHTCLKCVSALQLAHRFAASHEKVMHHRNIVSEPGKAHLWNFLSDSENRQAVATAGPPPARKKAPDDNEGFEEEELLYWKLGVGPADSSGCPVVCKGKKQDSAAELGSRTSSNSDETTHIEEDQPAERIQALAGRPKHRGRLTKLSDVAAATDVPVAQDRADADIPWPPATSTQTQAQKLPPSLEQDSDAGAPATLRDRLSSPRGAADSSLSALWQADAKRRQLLAVASATAVASQGPPAHSVAATEHLASSLRSFLAHGETIAGRVKAALHAEALNSAADDAAADQCCIDKDCSTGRDAAHGGLPDISAAGQSGMAVDKPASPVEPVAVDSSTAKAATAGLPSSGLQQLQGISSDSPEQATQQSVAKLVGLAFAVSMIPCNSACWIIFQQQFCHAGKPVIVRDIQPQCFWDPDTLKRATKDTKGTWAKDKEGRKIQIKDAKPLKVIDMRDLKTYYMKQDDFFVVFKSGGDQLQCGTGTQHFHHAESEGFPVYSPLCRSPAQTLAGLHAVCAIPRVHTPRWAAPCGFASGYGPSEARPGSQIVHSHWQAGPVRCGRTTADAKSNPTYGGAGAVWDIFQRQDVPALTKYLMKHCGEFSHAGKPIKREAIAHAIHSQTFFLTLALLSSIMGRGSSYLLGALIRCVAWPAV